MQGKGKRIIRRLFHASIAGATIDTNNSKTKKVKVKLTDWTYRTVGQSCANHVCQHSWPTRQTLHVCRPCCDAACCPCDGVGVALCVTSAAHWLAAEAELSAHRLYHRVYQQDIYIMLPCYRTAGTTTTTTHQVRLTSLFSVVTTVTLNNYHCFC